MARSSNPVLMMKARDMYARGFSKSATARAVHVSRATVCRWAAQDEAQHLGWDKERQARRHPSEEKVMEVLKDRMAFIVAEGGAWRRRAAHGRRLARQPANVRHIGRVKGCLWASYGLVMG